MSYPNLKLTYFDMAGRAELIRLALTIGDIPFEDERIARESWPALKHTLPFKQMPTLTVDGQVLCQSRAIARYAGSLSGLYPTENLVDACEVDELCDFVEEFYSAIVPTVHEPDAEKKKAMREALAKDKLPELFTMLEARLATSSSKGPWYLDTITLADLSVYTTIAIMKSGYLEHIPTDICDKYEKTMAIYNAVDNHPKVAAWNASHKSP